MSEATFKAYSLEKGSSAQKHMADTRRIAACWNALIDLPQEALDGGLEAHALKMQVQRDELLKALNQIAVVAEATVSNPYWIAKHARAAIAKATGENT